jgi:hypothetical protein
MCSENLMLLLFLFITHMRQITGLNVQQLAIVMKLCILGHMVT